MKANEIGRPSRPSLRVRVGVSGARKLRADQMPRIRTQVEQVLAQCKEFVEGLAAEKSVRDAYAPPAASQHKLLQLLSPLARGADRLVARAARDLGYDLYVPMPFSQEAYEMDFTGSDPASTEETSMTGPEDLQEFRSLLENADRLVLDGERGSAMDRGRAYEAVGRFVIRQSDFLIAIWDGGQGNGRGGTAEIVHYAATAGVPICWIHATRDRAPVWIEDKWSLRELSEEHHVHGADLEGKLRHYLKRLIDPPHRIRRHEETWIGRMASHSQEKSMSPIALYFEERPLSRRAIWQSHSRLMKMASRYSPPYAHPHPPDDPAALFWYGHYCTVDAMASQHAVRYRSSYVLVIILTTLALVFGACALGLAIMHSKISILAAGFELGTLMSIVLLVGASLRFDWHQRSIEYRLLAELFRKQETLATMGWALPIGNVQHMADTERLKWVAWLFAAMQRSAPLPTGRLRSSVSSRAALEHLVKAQLEYHHGREKMATRAAETFEKLGSLVFIAVIVCVALKVSTEFTRFEWPVVPLGLLATVLPGISAALIGIRRYAELELLAEQSRHMIAELKRAQERIAQVNMSQPSVSQDLGAEAAAVAATMLQDLEGWGRLFRGKLMEAA